MLAGKFQPESRSDRSKTIEQLCGTITSNVDIYKPQVPSLLFKDYIVSLLSPLKLKWDKSSLGDVGSNP